MSPPISPLWRGMHLAVLWAFALVQPLLDLLGGNAEFFVARGNGAADVIVFGLALTLLPPLALLGLEALVGLASKRAAWLLHLGLVGLLAGMFALLVLDGALDAGAGVLLVLALALGALAAVAYARAEAARSLLSYLSPAPAGVPGDVPVLLRRLGRRVPLRRGRRAGRRVGRPAGRDGALRRVPDGLPDGRRRQGPGEALPELRRPGSRGHLVPRRDDGGRPHRRRDPRDPDRAASRPRARSDRRGLPRQPLHPARRAPCASTCTSAPPGSARSRSATSTRGRSASA